MAPKNQRNTAVNRGIQRAGRVLSNREAQRISARTGVSAASIADRAQRQGVRVRGNVYGNQTPPPSTAPSEQANVNSGGDSQLDYLKYLGDLTTQQQGFMSELTGSFMSGFGDIANAFGQSLSSMRQGEDEDKARQAAEQKKRDEEARQSAIDEQLQGLRSGSTVGGTPGSGMEGAGSLASGRSSYQRSFTSALDNYRRAIDPTESVLDRDAGVDSIRRERRRRRDERGRRDLAGGARSGDYYARRFG